VYGYSQLVYDLTHRIVYTYILDIVIIDSMIIAMKELTAILTPTISDRVDLTYLWKSFLFII